VRSGLRRSTFEEVVLETTNACFEILLSSLSSPLDPHDQADEHDDGYEQHHDSRYAQTSSDISGSNTIPSACTSNISSPRGRSQKVTLSP
jgi:hypothetical protein